MYVSNELLCNIEASIDPYIPDLAMLILIIRYLTTDIATTNDPLATILSTTSQLHSQLKLTTYFRL
jgi:hypothetical protein